MKKFTPNQEFRVLAFLQSYATFLKGLFFCFPWLVLAWYFFGQFLAGTPEPQWWIEFEKFIIGP
jgi:hypothetical protein